jgi:hypothetical protein
MHGAGGRNRTGTDFMAEDSKSLRLPITALAATGPGGGVQVPMARRHDPVQLRRLLHLRQVKAVNYFTEKVTNRCFLTYGLAKSRRNFSDGGP